MKLFRKILWLSAMLTTFMGFSAAAIACDNTPGDNSSGGSSVSSTDFSSENSSESSSDSSSVDDNTLDYVYRISVQNVTGFGFEGVTVTLKNGDTVVASKNTNSSGNANFLSSEISTVGEYDIVVENLPEGYVLDDEGQKTVELAGTRFLVTISPTGLLSTPVPEGTIYQVGDIVHDFSVTLVDNTQYTLSNILKNKKMILLNFWATWCGPCLSEFPYMHNAVTAYEDTVSVLAISVSDTKEQVLKTQKENQYDKFNMAAVNRDIVARFGIDPDNPEVPLTVIIDRYGVMSAVHEGFMPSVSAFTSEFETYTSDEYLPTVVPHKKDDNGGNVGGGIEQILPTEEFEKIEDLTAVLADETASGFTFRYQGDPEVTTPDEEGYDKYNWPWLISGDNQFIYASNINVHNSYAILYATATVKGGDALVFDYKIDTEKHNDNFYVMLDGEIIKKYSGRENEKWNTSYSYVFKDYQAGEHEIAFVFLKDTTKTVGDDIVQIKNLRILSVADLDTPDVDANIFRHAATIYNTEANATTQFKNYANVYLSNVDGYYHVRMGETEDVKKDPILFANLINASPWNKQSVWNLAFSDFLVSDDTNYHDAMEDYAWEATQLTEVYGYTPVTYDLQYMLDEAARYVTYGANFNGEYHENEWLEMCVYWEHYGQTDLPEDPMLGFTFAAAIPLTDEKTNEITVPFAIKPRGFKHKFTPTVSGVYKVYSTGDEDTMVFLFDSDRETMLGEWNDKLFVEDMSDGNFEFYYYFKANKTYYLLLGLAQDQETVAYFNVDIEYVGTEYRYLTNAARGPYSTNLNTSEVYLPDAIDYAYSEETGYYHHVKEDGSLGSIIYLDTARPTAAGFSPYSLYKICQSALQSVANGGKESDNAFYIDGHDYSKELWVVCNDALKQEGELKGYMPVDKELFDLLQTVLMSPKFDGIPDTWLLMCYYYKTIDENS